MVGPENYGVLTEKYVSEKYPIELDYPMIDGIRFDGSRNGRPVEIKSAASNRKGGSVAGVPLFRIWKDEERVLKRERGFMIFVVYKKRGSGIAVEKSRSFRAREIDISGYMSKPVAPRDEYQAQVRASDIFNSGR